MKVYIHFKTHFTRDAFEGFRLRKTLKGACEQVGIEWVDSLKDSPAVAHFLSPFDFWRIRKCKKLGIKAVLSCFYAESDLKASFLCRRRGKTQLRPFASKTIREADLIQVPDAYFRDFLLSLNLNPNIEVVPPAVNLRRFDLSKIESSVFTSYYLVGQDTPFVMAVGSYSNEVALSNLRELSKLCPNVDFYFFGSRKGLYFPSLAKKRYKKDAGDNLHLERIPEDDVHRSALSKASYYLSLDPEVPNFLGVLEAFAAKVPILSVGKQDKNDLLSEGENFERFDSLADLAQKISSPYLKSETKTIMAGYMKAKSLNLLRLGENLLASYRTLLGENQ